MSKSTDEPQDLHTPSHSPKRDNSLNRREVVLCIILVIILVASLGLAWYVSTSATHSLRIL
jgi:uncharacterized membrane protein